MINRRFNPGQTWRNNGDYSISHKHRSGNIVEFIISQFLPYMWKYIKEKPPIYCDNLDIKVIKKNPENDLLLR